MASTDADDVVRELSEKMVVFLETGTAPEGSFRPDVFLDLSMPTWRIQAAGAEDLIGIRKDGHPGTGAMRAEVADGQIAELAVYCTGGWDHARQAEHTAAVTLIRR
jgi:hypothetical protein